MLCVIDDYSRECLALVADTSLSASKGACEVDHLIAQSAVRPKLLRHRCAGNSLGLRHTITNTRRLIDQMSAARPFRTSLGSEH